MGENRTMPRAKNITAFIKRDEIKSLKPKENLTIPSRILDYTGDVKEISFPQQGMCSLVVIIQGAREKYILKIAKGQYRGKELYAEFTAMNSLNNTNIPVATVYDFFEEKGLFYLLREYSKGIPLNLLFQNNNDKQQRLRMLAEMGKLLAKIHKMHKDMISYEAFINDQLYFAEQHYINNTIDLEDFIFDGIKEDPHTTLKWLKANKPSQGQVSLIHGDYRPKNILWYDNQISSIVDWAFCDIGDPYYDLAIFSDYFIDNEEKQIFLQSYGIKTLDENRLKYFYKLAPFINI